MHHYPASWHSMSAAPFQRDRMTELCQGGLPASQTAAQLKGPVAGCSAAPA